MKLYEYDYCFKLISRIDKKISEIIYYLFDNYYDLNDIKSQTLEEILEFFQSKAEEEFHEFINKQKSEGIKNKRNGYRTRIIRTI